MIDKLLSYIAPHHCYSCANIGSILCDNCKFHILEEPYEQCIQCDVPSQYGVCKSCQQKLPYSNAWIVGERKSVLENIIHDYKFRRNVAAVQASADLLEKRLPYLPDNTTIIPVPTITRHIRIRGYDHTSILANQVAKKRSLKYINSLKRNHNLVQVGSDAKTRHQQAKTAFFITEKLDTTRPYLLIDDVITTGATIKYAAQSLRDAGAQEIWIAALAR